jgi:hypothetical protein
MNKMSDPLHPGERLAMAESRIRRLEEKVGHLQHLVIGGGSLAVFAAFEHYGRVLGVLGLALALVFLWWVFRDNE